MIPRIVTLAGCIALLVTSGCSDTQSPYAGMSFEVLSDEDGNRWIQASGPIVSDTSKKFTEFVQSLPDLGQCQGAKNCNIDTVALDSLGGDLLEGLMLGHLFRDFGFNTYIAAKGERRTPVRTTDSDGEFVWRFDPKGVEGKDYKIVGAFSPGQCFSACAYAFLGGHERDLFKLERPKNDALEAALWEDKWKDARIIASKFGVHQFSGMRPTASGYADEIPNLKWPAADEQNIEERIQFVSGEIVQYLTDMGVSPTLFQIASRTKKDEIQTGLADYTLASMNVLTSTPQSKWEMVGVGHPMSPEGNRLRYTETSPSSPVDTFWIHCDSRKKAVVFETNFSSYVSKKVARSLPTMKRQLASGRYGAWSIAIGEDVYGITPKNAVGFGGLLALSVNVKDIRRPVTGRSIRIKQQAYGIIAETYRPAHMISLYMSASEVRMLQSIINRCPI